MSNIKELSPKANVNLLFVDDIPKKATGFEVSIQDDRYPCVTYWYNENLDPTVISLPPGHYTPLGIATELSEEVVRELVEVEPAFRSKCKPCYKHYHRQGAFEVCNTAVKSFASLLRAHNISERSLVLKINK